MFPFLCLMYDHATVEHRVTVIHTHTHNARLFFVFFFVTLAHPNTQHATRTSPSTPMYGRRASQRPSIGSRAVTSSVSPPSLRPPAILFVASPALSKKAEGSLKRALLDLYRDLTLLQNFAIVNYTAVVKVCCARLGSWHVEFLGWGGQLFPVA